jgi:hypothetical protein
MKTNIHASSRFQLIWEHPKHCIANSSLGETTKMYIVYRSWSISVTCRNLRVQAQLQRLYSWSRLHRRKEKHVNSEMCVWSSSLSDFKKPSVNKSIYKAIYHISRWQPIHLFSTGWWMFKSISELIVQKKVANCVGHVLIHYDGRVTY